MKPTDEQLRQIGYAAISNYWGGGEAEFPKAGRAAFEASCKIALAEPTSEELALGWNKAATIGQVMWNDIVREVFANRLRSLTAEPKDEALEAVLDVLWGKAPSAMAREHCIETAKKCVEAVYKARGRK